MSSSGPKPITGYCEPWCVAPGETVRFLISCYEPGSYRADVVRTICGDVYPMGGGFREEEIPSDVAGDYPGRLQSTQPGSFARMPSRGQLSGLESVTAAAVIYSTRPGRGAQSILGNWDERAGAGFALALDPSGALMFRVARDASVCTGLPVEARRWTLVAASYDATTGLVRLLQRPLPVSAALDAAARDAQVETTTARGARIGHSGPVFAAAWGGPQAEGCAAFFDGKIDSPRLLSCACDFDEMAALPKRSVPEARKDHVLGWWDFSRDISSERVSDLGPLALHGQTEQLPTRAVTGFRWDGAEQDWKRAPDHYGAIHFHSDDLADAGWEADFSFRVPPDFRSGIYAARLRMGQWEDHVQFFVRAPRNRATADVAFLVPTASYLAYANHKVHLAFEAIFNETAQTELHPNDATMLAHPEFGPSLYCHHSDGSGVAISSAHRPITNLRSRHTPWAFTADTRISAWLEQAGFAYDVITDEDLHAEGAPLLERYRAVLTGTHPEYTSTAMFDAIDTYLGGGGRLMYLGGNGFYWRIAFHPTRRGVIEVRRAEDGTRAWIAEPGESYHAFNGEYGGLWRRVRRAPNTLVGVGFAAQGFDRSTYYRRTAASADPRVTFLFKGVEEDVIGEFGRRASPSGEEIDRYDAHLGSPRHALVVATSERHSAGMLRTKEEFFMTVPPRSDPAVRSDLTFFECANGGAVFSTGSINWAAALAHNAYQNDVARITRNALERFLDPTPFTVPGG